MHRWLIKVLARLRRPKILRSAYTIPADAFADADGDTLTLSASGLPSWLTLSGDTLSGTPLEGDGDVTVTITATDPSGASVSDDLAITVTAVNDTPTADSQSVTVAEDGSVVITLTGSDVDGDVLSYALGATSPSNGTVTIAGNQATYTPDSDFNGPDSFSVCGQRRHSRFGRGDCQHHSDCGQ